jgi:hypothetical protein
VVYIELSRCSCSSGSQPKETLASCSAKQKGENKNIEKLSSESLPLTDKGGGNGRFLCVKGYFLLLLLIVKIMGIFLFSMIKLAVTSL